MKTVNFSRYAPRFFIYLFIFLFMNIILLLMHNKAEFSFLLFLKEALSKYQEIHNNLDFARELQKSFLALGQEVKNCSDFFFVCVGGRGWASLVSFENIHFVPRLGNVFHRQTSDMFSLESGCQGNRQRLCVQVQKAVKKSARREQLQREETEQRRLKTVLELQYLLDQLGDDGVRQDLKGLEVAGSPLLTDGDLASFDEFYKLVGPDRNYELRYACFIRNEDCHCSVKIFHSLWFDLLVGWLNSTKTPRYTCGLCLRAETRLWQEPHVSVFIHWGNTNKPFSLLEA